MSSATSDASSAPPRQEAKLARFKCLRCGAEFELPYTPGKVEERQCPKCESNSVRRLREVNRQ